MRVFQVIDYRPVYQDGIDTMMETIAQDYPEPISGPHSAKLFEECRHPNRQYWVALEGDKVVGTVGLVLLKGVHAVLKRMMTDPGCRGTGLADLLLKTALDWGKVRAVETVYFGTMQQFRAAQKFYAKQGCQEVAIEQLPSDMEINPIDAIHYRLDLR